MQRDAPNLPGTHASGTPGAASLRDRAGGVIAFAIALTLLYLGRDVLIPLTLALMLSLLIAPLVRLLKRIGLGQTAAVLIAVLALAISFVAVAGTLASQVLKMAASLPQYQDTIQQKLQNLDELTVGKLNALTNEASRLIDKHRTASAPGILAPASELPGHSCSGGAARTPLGPAPNRRTSPRSRLGTDPDYRDRVGRAGVRLARARGIARPLHPDCGRVPHTPHHPGVE
jgi:hypothetical protein